MKRAFTLKAGLGAVLLLLLGAVAVRQWAGWLSKPPHVIIISVDTLRRDHVTAYGYEGDTTPVIDSLAAAGAVFDEAFAACTNTAPSHATMLTGLYPPSHGIVRNTHRLKPGVRTLAEMLGEEGYRTGAFVSGYTLRKGHTSLDRGFEHYDENFRREQRPAPLTARAALEWVLGGPGGDKPMFLFFHLFDPHAPYAPPPAQARPFMSEGQDPDPGKLHSLIGQGGTPREMEDYRRFYDAEIRYADTSVGKLIETLKEAGFWDRALVIFLSDHGETLDDRFWPFDHGARLYEEQIDVPFMIRFPRDAYAGTRVGTPVHHVDLLPTVLDYLGLPLPQGLHGRSLMPLIERAERGDPGRPIFSVARPEPARVPEAGAPLDRGGMVVSLRRWPYKLIAYPGEEGPILQLFDLAGDPGEERNVAAAESRILADLRDKLDSWYGAVGAAEIPPAQDLSPETEKQLRSLGYIR